MRTRAVNGISLALPYGLAVLALQLAFNAGNFGGDDLIAPFYALRLLSWAACLAWLPAVAWAFQRVEGWGLVTLPSLLLILTASGDSIVLAGACSLAQNCL